MGLLVSGAALAGTSVLGLGESDGGGQASSDQSINVPKPEPTDEQTGALITLEPKPSSEGDEESEAAPEPEDAISLSAAVTDVRPGEPIDLSGVYPGGEGATLVVQRLEEGQWVDFAEGDVTATGQQRDVLHIRHHRTHRHQHLAGCGTQRPTRSPMRCGSRSADDQWALLRA